MTITTPKEFQVKEQDFKPEMINPAFPSTVHYGKSQVQCTGLSKRKYFAGLAMQGIMSNHRTEPTREEHFKNNGLICGTVLVYSVV